MTPRPSRLLLNELIAVAVAAVCAATIAAGCARGPQSPVVAGSSQQETSSALAAGGTPAASQPAASENASGSATAERSSWVLPRLATLGQPITHGPGSRKEVALTFDACESKTPASFDANIFGILKDENVAATVFVGGKWLSHNQAAAKALAADSAIEIGSHSWDHPDFSKLTTDEIRSQMVRTDSLIVQVTGRQPVLFRLPYGTYNERALRVLRSMRAPVITWDVVSGDPDPNVKAPAMIREILARARPGSIVIMHINGRGVHTAEALPAVIKGLRAKGYELVTVSRLLR